MIVTERLRGDRPAERHRSFVRALLADPRVGEPLWPGELGGAPSVAQAVEPFDQDLAHWAEHGFGARIWIERATGAPVARGGAMHLGLEGEVNVELLWAVVPEHWGRGFATELALATLDEARADVRLTEVVAVTTPANLASQAVMRRVGLGIEREVEHAGLLHVLFRASV